MTADTVAGRYRLEERLSATAMADVWLATDPVLERQVVVKLLAADADRERFEREARAAAALAHPNIVQLFDYGEDRGRPYMVLEYLPGGTLADRLPEGAPLPDDVTRVFASEVAAGLAHAHLQGVVHRDLKPGNVLFDSEERAKVGDFGIARIQGTDTITDEGTVLGTAAYMAPEQVEGHSVTPAADVYAFGVLLYRMLSGRFPFESENALQLARMHRDFDPPPVRSVRPDAPADLAALTTAALAKDPSARPADGAALMATLEDGESPQSLVTDAATVRLPAFRRRRSARLAVLVAGMVLLAAGIASAVILAAGSNSSAPPVTSRTRVTSTTSGKTESTATQTTSSSTGSSETSTTQPTTTHTTTASTTTPPTTTVVTSTIATTTAPTTTGP
jgi:eukaryotic-like serine/threonine-protein kinase